MSRPKITKPDTNQAQIVEDLRNLGFDVDIVCHLPGLYDLVVSGRKYFHNEDFLSINVPCSLRVEIKSEKGKLTAAEM